MNKSKNQPITQDNIKKVQPINDADNENQFISKQLLKHAEWLNMLAKIGFIVFLVIMSFSVAVIAIILILERVASDQCLAERLMDIEVLPFF